MGLKPNHAKFQQSSARGTFSDLEVDRKNVHFSMENWLCRRRWEI